MKLKTILLSIALCIFLAPASYAGYWSIGYDNQSVSIGDVIDVDLNFTNEETESIWVAGFDVTFDIDAAELDPVYISSGPNSGYDIDYFVGGSLFEDWDSATGEYTVAGADMANWYEIGAGATFTVATLHFTVLEGVLLDGLFDVILQDQRDAIIAKGIEIYNPDALFGGDMTAFAGANGPDVGSVPVPGAFWLLSSGLLGLAGLRRKK